MPLDIATLFVVFTVIDMTMGLYFLIVWLGDRERMIFLWMGASAASGAIGCVLFMFRGHAPDWLIVWIAYVFFVQSLGFSWTAVRHVNRRPHPVWLTGLGVVIWTVACLIPPVYQSEVCRNFVSSALIAGYSLAMSFEMLRRRGEGAINSRLMASLALFLHSCMCMSLVSYSLVHPEAFIPLVAKDAWAALMILESIVNYIVMVLTLTTLELDNEAAHQRAAAATDVLTGILNRRAFMDRASKLLGEGRCEAALLVFDIDHFKQINDTFGHAGGDRTLELFAYEVTSRLAAYLPPAYAGATGSSRRPWREPIFGRIGGEEFACLLPHATTQCAERLAEEIRDAVSRLNIRMDEAVLSITVSIGVASASDVGAEINSLLLAADNALYRAKRDGRNRVESGLELLPYVA